MIDKVSKLIFGLFAMKSCLLLLQHVLLSIYLSLHQLRDNRYFFSTVYASTTYTTHRQLWLELESLYYNKTSQAPGATLVTLMWFRGRMKSVEVLLLYCTPLMTFWAWTDSCSLVHLPTSGVDLTWSNGRNGGISLRLDRATCDKDSFNLWSLINCRTLPRVSSDHFPLPLSSTA